MSETGLVHRTAIAAPSASPVVPAIVAAAGEKAARRYLEFFAVTIENANTREAYYRACRRFFAWCDLRGLTELVDIEPMHVAAYIKSMRGGFEKPSVKQHLAAIRMLFDWLVVGQVVATNPAHSVRGPKHVVKRGKTPVLTADQARVLLDSIDVSTVVGLRDRALIALMAYSFARVSAAVAMRVEDYFATGKRWWVRLHEKGGKRHEMPAHHNLEAYLDAYLHAAGITDAKRTPLFRSANWHTGALTESAMHRVDVWRMISPARQGRRHRRRNVLPHFPGDGDHRLSRQRRHFGERSGHGGARKPANDQALRSHRR